MKNVTHTISTITFAHCLNDLRIIYNGPIHSANAIINRLYLGLTGKVGSTAFSDIDLNYGDYQIIEVSTGRIIDEVSTITPDQFDLLLSRNKAT